MKFEVRFRNFLNSCEIFKNRKKFRIYIKINYHIKVTY